MATPPRPDEWDWDEPTQDQLDTLEDELAVRGHWEGDEWVFDDDDVTYGGWSDDDDPFTPRGADEPVNGGWYQDPRTAEDVILDDARRMNEAMKVMPPGDFERLVQRRQAKAGGGRQGDWWKPKEKAEPEPEYVWYASYGSNMSRDRFMVYLEGGSPPGSARAYSGCRDKTPPVADMPVRFPHRMFFAQTSPVWGGAVSFLGHEEVPEDEGAYGRAYLVTKEQFDDIVAQENGGEAGDRFVPVNRAVKARKLTVGPGWYETIRVAGEEGGYPIVTFTGRQDEDKARLNAPTLPYMEMIAAGLREAHGLSDPEIAEYLTGASGAAGAWTTDEVEDALSGGQAAAAATRAYRARAKRSLVDRLLGRSGTCGAPKASGKGTCGRRIRENGTCPFHGWVSA